VSETYGRVYDFQQQHGCQERGTFHLTVPSEYTEDDEMNESIPEVVNGSIMGVKFDVWLEKDPKIHNFGSDWENGLFWERNFYPDINTVANDLFEKGLIEAGSYLINIDW
jgi:hypothetical protein